VDPMASIGTIRVVAKPGCSWQSMHPSPEKTIDRSASRPSSMIGKKRPGRVYPSSGNFTPARAPRDAKQIIQQKENAVKKVPVPFVLKQRGRGPFFRDERSNFLTLGWWMIFFRRESLIIGQL
jgi:hypothetical protein